MLAGGDRAGATSLVTGFYQLDATQDVDRTGADTAHVNTVKQTLELKYRGFMSPVVQNEFTFRVEQEINSDAPNVNRFFPTLELGFKGRYWEAKSGGKRTYENSDEPGKTPKITESSFVEFFYIPPKNIPDLKLKYTVDTDFQEGTSDTRKDSLIMSSLYRFNDWLDFKGDFTRDLNDNRLQPDSDTKEQKRTLTVNFRRFVGEKIKFDAQYTVEEDRNDTLLDSGGVKDKKEDETHRVKSTFSFRPLRFTTLDASYDYEIKQNMVSGEHNLTTNAKATLDQQIGKPFDLKLEFLRAITDDRHTTDDKTKTEDTATVELRARFSKQLDFTAKNQVKDTDEVHADPTKSTTGKSLIKNATWNGELTPFWRAYASYDKTDTFVDESKTTVDTKYSLKSTFDFKGINLVLEPTYDLTFSEDFLTPAESTTGDFKFRLGYKILPTNNIEAGLEHTYGRKTDSGAGNIQRTDNSTGNITVKNPLPGWHLSFDITRAATDTSEDDLAPDITTTFGFKVDYVYEKFILNTNYKYDKKSLTDDAETFDFKVGWIAPKWQANLTYNFTKTFSELLNEGYSVALTFKYMI